MSAITAAINCFLHFTFETAFNSVGDDDRGKENTFMLDDKPQKPASSKLKSRSVVIILHCIYMQFAVAATVCVVFLDLICAVNTKLKDSLQPEPHATVKCGFNSLSAMQANKRQLFRTFQFSYVNAHDYPCYAQQSQILELLYLTQYCMYVLKWSIHDDYGNEKYLVIRLRATANRFCQKRCVQSMI